MRNQHPQRRCDHDGTRKSRHPGGSDHISPAHRKNGRVQPSRAGERHRACHRRRQITAPGRKRIAPQAGAKSAGGAAIGREAIARIVAAPQNGKSSTNEYRNRRKRWVRRPHAAYSRELSRSTKPSPRIRFESRHETRSQPAEHRGTEHPSGRHRHWQETARVGVAAGKSQRIFGFSVSVVRLRPRSRADLLDKLSTTLR